MKKSNTHWRAIQVLCIQSVTLFFIFLFVIKTVCIYNFLYSYPSFLFLVPLSSEHKYDLSWEGANLRLYDSSAITEAEAESRNKKTGDFARMHMDTMKTGAFLQGLVHRGKKQHSTD